MKYKNRIAVLLALVLLLCALPVTAYAHEVPDMAQKGSISIELSYGGKRVSGGTLTAYRVAQIVEDDGNYSFEALPPYRVKELSQENLNTPELAASFAAQTGSAKGIAPASADNGLVRFDGLELGLYLIVQTEAAPGYTRLAPFLVTVPVNEDGHYVYQVDAQVKGELEKEPLPSPTPGVPGEPKLPQTGQLNWPVPVLAALGLGLIVAGLAMRRKAGHA